jgi:hypothetical protein
MEKPETSNCSGRHHCGNWRTCTRCANFRAARIADRAEYLQQRHGKLSFAVAKPKNNTEADIKKLRNSIVRSKLAPAGLWTIETGELYAGLHLNLLLPTESLALDHGRFEYIETIRTSTRAAAAYICKRQGMPLPNQYAGRLQGEWGSVVQHLMNSDDLQAAPAQAAALEMALSGKRSIADYYKTDEQMREKNTTEHQKKPEKSRADYEAIMRRNLSAVFMTISNHTQPHP